MEATPEQELETFRTELGSLVEEHRARQEAGRLDYDPGPVQIISSELTEQDRQVWLNSESLTLEEFREYKKTIPPESLSRQAFAGYIANKINARIMKEG